MPDRTDPNAEAFLLALEAALGGPGLRATEVTTEVRTDLEAAVAHAVEQGRDERTAWREALEDLGDPQDLAAAMRGPLPPEAPAPWVAHARRAAAILLAVWTLMIAWSVRSWDYGGRFGLFSFLIGLHLPFVLLLWPGIVWRWNALFSTATALTVLFLGWLISFGASRAEIVLPMPEQELAIATVPEEPSPPRMTQVSSDAAFLSREAFFALLSLAFVALVLSSIQQRKQRRRILVVTALLVLAVDLPHTIEEWLFVREARSAAAWLEEERERTGVLPTREQFASGYAPLLIDDLYLSFREDTDFNLSWSRATQRTSELGYHSDGRIWGND